MEKKGNLESQAVIGYLYKYGIGLKKNLKKALNLTKQAADQGDPTGLYNLGISYYTGDGLTKDKILGKELIEKAALQGHLLAQFRLSNIYREDEKNPELAVYWLQKAAQDGYAPAQFYLGKHYVSINNLDAAISLLESAAKANYGPAKFYLSQLYYSMYHTDNNTGICSEINCEREAAFSLRDAYYQCTKDKNVNSYGTDFWLEILESQHKFDI